MDTLQYVTSGQLLSAPKGKNMRSKASQGGINALRCSMAAASTYMRLIFGVLAVS